MTKVTETTDSNPVELHDDGFTINEKLMVVNVMYEFIYDDTNMAVKKLPNGALQVFSE